MSTGISLTFECPCGRRLRAKAGFAGRHVGCPNCGVTLVVPAWHPAGSGPGLDSSQESDDRTSATPHSVPGECVARSQIDDVIQSWAGPASPQPQIAAKDEKVWYYKDAPDFEPRGPFRLMELAAMADGGAISGQSSIRLGDGRWCSASKDFTAFIDRAGEAANTFATKFEEETGLSPLGSTHTKLLTLLKRANGWSKGRIDKSRARKQPADDGTPPASDPVEEWDDSVQGGMEFGSLPAPAFRRGRAWAWTIAACSVLLTLAALYAAAYYSMTGLGYEWSASGAKAMFSAFFIFVRVFVGLLIVGGLVIGLVILGLLGLGLIGDAMKRSGVSTTITTGFDTDNDFFVSTRFK